MRLPIDRLARWIEPSGRPASAPSPTDVFALVASIDHWLVRARPIVKSGCLTRGVTLYRFLRRAGANAEDHRLTLVILSTLRHTSGGAAVR